MEFFDVIKERHSYREFLDKKVEQEKVDKILSAINSAPSAGNLQAFEVVLVREKETKQKLRLAALDQESIAQAGIVLVFFANPLKSFVKYTERGAELYSVQDATIAASYAQLASFALGLGSVWIGAFDNEKVSRALAASENLVPVAIIPIGYKSGNHRNTGRRKIRDIVRAEKF